MTSTVQRAIAEIKASFPSKPVTVREDGEGGAYVTVENVELGAGWTPNGTWIGFRITFQYPNADVYPHYVRNDLRRANGQPGPTNMTAAVFEGRPAFQVSRRSNRLNPAVDTAVLKLHKVIRWLK